MKLRDEMTTAKLRGGFYTPAPLVQFCLDQIRCPGASDELRILEPSAGDGAFIRGISSHPLRERVGEIYAIEIARDEAAKVSEDLARTGAKGSVLLTSTLGWAAATDELFDAVVGNPPFVRYQFLSQDDKRSIEALGDRLGVHFSGVGNLWIPLLLGSLSRLRPGGAFALVIPTECFTGISAGVARDWLIRNTLDIRFDLFPPGSFPSVLQEVTVISGRRSFAKTVGTSTITMVEHQHTGEVTQWAGAVTAELPNWMELLLEPDVSDSLKAARALSHVLPLSSVARLEVSIVTGANDYFCVSNSTASAFELHAWTRPLLPRIRHAPGLIFAEKDQQDLLWSDAKAWLLDFGSDAPDPRDHARAAEYLQLGTEQGLDARYKCRIRAPWYRVPSIRAGKLMMSKRSHRYPRLVANEAGSFTTDTIYRGDLLEPRGDVTERDLVAGFHNSLTLLTAELCGRSFGGGVLELVPGELARLAVVKAPGLGTAIDRLDLVARSGDPDALIAETDELLIARGLISREMMQAFSTARRLLQERRLDRSVADRGEVAVAA